MNGAALTIAQHPGAEAQERGALSWVATVDHKRIGILYLVTTFFFLSHRRGGSVGDAPATGPAGKPPHQPWGLQPAFYDARDDDDLSGGHAGLDRVRQLLRAADDWRARHGVSALERHELLVSGFWRAAACTSAFWRGARRRPVGSVTRP
jgi:hypothetical protein